MTTDQEDKENLDRTVRLTDPPGHRKSLDSVPSAGLTENFEKTQPLLFSQSRFFSLKKRRDVSDVMAEQRDKRPQHDVIFSGSEDKLESLDDSYDRGSKFAEGGQGVLLRGFDRKLQRQVAVKSLKQEFTDDKEQRGRFLTEARVTAQLDHPAVVPIYTLNSDSENGLHLTMKLINGETFKAYLNQVCTHYRLDGIAAYNESKALRDRIDIFLKICDALEYAHSRNVMHGDLKPSNIMIGEYRETYIMDWGIARKIDDPEIQKNDETPNVISGTPQYLAPEAIRGEQCDQRADIFAMGAILFETVTLKNAFNGENVQEILTNICYGKMESIEHFFRASIDSDLKAIIRKATANHPADRYQQIGELSGDLRRYLTGLDVSAKPDNPIMKMIRCCYLHRRITLIVMLCGLLLGAGALSFALYREFRFSEQQRLRDYAMGEAFSLSSIAGYQLDEQFAKVELMTDVLASDIQFLFQYDLHPDHSQTDKQHQYYSLKELKQKKIPGMVYSQFHRGLINDHAIVYNTTPDTKRREIRDRLETITRFVPRMLQTILESPVRARISADGFHEMKMKAFRDGTPVIRVIFGFPDGLFVAYPASSDFPEIYDPRTRPWYKAANEKMKNRAAWMPPYIDSIPDFGLVLSCSVPLHLLGTRGSGICTVDISLSELIEELQTSGNDGPYVLEKAIVDNTGQVIVSTTRNFADARILNVKNTEGEVKFPLLDDPSLLLEMEARKNGIVTRRLAGREIIYTYCHIRSVDWFYVEKLDMTLLLQSSLFAP